MTNDQYEALLIRVTKLEDSFNDLVVALSRFATLNQVQGLMAIVQQDLASVHADLDGVVLRITELENEPDLS